MKKVIILFSLILVLPLIQAQDPSEKQSDKETLNDALKTSPAKKVTPYSPARMTSSGLLFISGQIPIIPETGTVMKGNIEEETKLVMNRIGFILKENAMDYSDLVKCTVFLTDIRDYQAVNNVYISYFKDEFPAREAIEVVNLPLGASIEISGIAAK